MPGPEAPKAVVVLSDGETTVGRPDSEAAAAAVEAGVPVYTISFGTRSGTIDFQGERIAVPRCSRSAHAHRRDDGRAVLRDGERV